MVYDPERDVLLSMLEADQKAPSPKAQLNITILPVSQETPFDVDKKRFPWLCTLGRNLTALAFLGKLDEAQGRENELSQVIDVLLKRRGNNPCLVGEPGVGKTALVEGLAVKLARKDEDVKALFDKAIIELEMGKITAGTSLRGAFSERIQGLKKEMEAAHGRVIVFIDEIHTLMGAQLSGDSSQDAANELKSALARGTFPCIGSTTFHEYHKYIASDPAFERRFCKIAIDEPSEAVALAMLQKSAVAFSNFHRMQISQEALLACVQLSSRYIGDKRLPAKAVDLLDLSLSKAKRLGDLCLRKEHVALACSAISGVPREQLMLEPAKRLLGLEDLLSQQIVGHEKAIHQLASGIRRGYAGFSRRQPLASFLCVGPPSVGKKHSALVLCELLFGTQEAFLYINMAEFSEGHSVARLLGAPPGYLGHDDAGLFAKALRKRQHCVVFFDGIEKAHKDVRALVLELVRNGFLVNQRGEILSFGHSVVVLACHFTDADTKSFAKPMGFLEETFDADKQIHHYTQQARFLVPDLLDLCGEVVAFLSFREQDAHALIKLFLVRLAQHILKEHQLQLVYDPILLSDSLWETYQSFNKQDVTALLLQQLIRDTIEDALSQVLLAGELKPGSKIELCPRISSDSSLNYAISTLDK